MSIKKLGQQEHSHDCLPYNFRELTLQELLNKFYCEMKNQEINITNELYSRIHDLAEINVLEHGCINDGKTDNSNALQKIFNSVKNYETIFFPKGDYLIKIKDDNIKACTNGYVLLELIDKVGINIRGNGRLILDTSNCTKKNWLLYAIRCRDLNIEGLKIIGDTEFIKDEIISSYKPNGIVFEQCSNVKFINNTIRNVLCALSTTGNGHSPSLTSEVSDITLVSNNVFENYGQISTYGGGSKNFIFSNNICKNTIQCMIKLSSNPLINSETLGNSYNNTIQGNIMVWEKDFEFPIVDWNPTKIYSPVGIMVECHSQNVKISDNIVDMSHITQDMTNNIQEIGGIIILKSNSNTDYYYKDIDIKNNYVHSMTNKSSLVLTPMCEKYNINGNTLYGKIGIGTTSELIKSCDSLNIIGNTINGIDIFSYLTLNVWYDDINIFNNVFNGGSGSDYNSLIELVKIKGTTINIKGNVFENGQLISYSNNPIDVKTININSNFIGKITMHLNANVESLNINSNNVNVGATWLTINSNNDNTRIAICNNSGRVTGVVNVNKGILRLDGNSLDTSIATPYLVGDCLIRSGYLTGSGAPNYKAWSGVIYNNLGSVTNALYINTSNGVTTGWKQIT